MKVAILSDVQGNLPAFEAVVEDILGWNAELVIVAGDLLNRGPDSRGCLDLFHQLQREHRWIALRGNHEDYLLHCSKSQPESPQEAELRRFADWSLEQLNPADLAGIQAWADHLEFSDPECCSWVHVTHGTLAGNRDGISQSVSDDSLAGKLPPETDLFVTAHTHKPLQRALQETRILNVGSVGSPFDRDVRASYARLTFVDGYWHSRIRRIAYDRQRTQLSFEQSGFLDQAGPLAALIHHEWQQAEMFMARWNRQYRAAVLAGEITAADAVNRFLAAL